MSLGLREVASLGTEVVVRFRHVQEQVGKAHLLRRGFVTEPIRRHLLDGSDQVFLLVGKDLLHYARDRIFVLLREANRSRSKSERKAIARFMAMLQKCDPRINLRSQIRH